jgi:hypothetical protein
MIYNLVTNRLESTYDFENHVFPIVNNIMDSFLTVLVDHIMDGTFDRFIDMYDGTYEEGFWEYIHLIKSGVIK